MQVRWEGAAVNRARMWAIGARLALPIFLVIALVEVAAIGVEALLTADPPRRSQ